ncbi:MAG: hypothetical protein JF606_25825 [Burkholderiales bacterium]|jgi:ribosome-binding protein aMBF1 (putative translation factor)|nr:hypothetical protein [Burkholderiales bacterium]
MSPEGRQRLPEITSSDGYASRALREIARVGSCVDDASVIEVLHDAKSAFGVDHTRERAGMSTKEIAEELGTTVSAVDSRFHRLSTKFNTPNRRATARLAAEYGLI